MTADDRALIQDLERMAGALSVHYNRRAKDRADLILRAVKRLRELAL